MSSYHLHNHTQPLYKGATTPTTAGEQSLTTAATTCNQTSSTQFYEEGTLSVFESSAAANPTWRRTGNSDRQGTEKPTDGQDNNTTLQSFVVNGLKSISLSRLVVGDDGESTDAGATNAACWCKSLNFLNDEGEGEDFDEDDQILYSTKFCRGNNQKKHSSRRKRNTKNRNARDERDDFAGDDDTNASTATAPEGVLIEDSNHQHSLRNAVDPLRITKMEVLVYKPKDGNIFESNNDNDENYNSYLSYSQSKVETGETPLPPVTSPQPKLKIVWDVEQSQESGFVDKWTGRLLFQGSHENTGDDIQQAYDPSGGEDDIGWITMYSINSQIARHQSVVSDTNVKTFVDDFLIPNTTSLSRQRPSAVSRAPSDIPLIKLPSIGSMTFEPTANNITSSAVDKDSSPDDANLALSNVLFPSFSMGDGGDDQEHDRLVFLVSDITLQPLHRRSGLGLVLLDAACRQIAEESSLVVVSLKEALDDKLQLYFGLLGFVLAPQGKLDASLSSPTLGRRTRTQDLAVGMNDDRDKKKKKKGDFLVRRNGPHCPFIDDICPYFPPAVPSTVASDY